MKGITLKKRKYVKKGEIEKEKDKGGRPRVHDEIDWDDLKKLAETRNTAEDCAYILGMSMDTLDRRVKEKYGYGYAEFFKRNSTFGGARVRKEMYNLAVEEHNPTMLIWLSKNWLGMKDSVDHNVDVKPLTFAYSLEENAK